ncbi:MAG: hypothetical protein ACLF0G_15400 [Candidatus Brocadiia bacterium]
MAEACPNQPEPIPIKPHHFVDILRALGRGQAVFEPHPYGHALHLVAARLLADRDAPLAIELGADAICAPCIHNVGGRCDDTIDTSFRPQAPASKQEWNLLLDTRWCERLGLAQGECLAAHAFARRIAARMGDLADVYRELPPRRTAERARHLRAGTASFVEA